jgi:cysteine desulfurase
MTTEHNPVYLDHNATTPLLPEVVDAMLPYLREHFGNPSSGHSYGARARSAVARARAQVAALLGCDSEEVLFTSGGTEANNLAIRGIAADRSHIVTSVIEHPATSRPCDWLESHGWCVSRVGVDSVGRIRQDEVAAAIAADTALITVMHSNNETGVLQPIAELAATAHRMGALMHTDAAQSIGKVPVKVHDLDADLLSIAGHKLYAPKGVGALFVRRGVELTPLLLGADHERGLRPGTENVASIVALGQACELLDRDLDSAAHHMRHLRDRLWALLAAGVPGLALNGHPELRLPNTLNVRFPGVSGAAVLANAPQIAASTGTACHAGQDHASKAILAMGVAADEALGSVRLSLGRGTTESGVTLAALALVSAWESVVPSCLTPAT